MATPTPTPTALPTIDECTAVLSSYLAVTANRGSSSTDEFVLNNNGSSENNNGGNGSSLSSLDAWRTLVERCLSAPPPIAMVGGGGPEVLAASLDWYHRRRDDDSDDEDDSILRAVVDGLWAAGVIAAVAEDRTSFGPSASAAAAGDDNLHYLAGIIRRLASTPRPTSVNNNNNNNNNDGNPTTTATTTTTISMPPLLPIQMLQGTLELGMLQNANLLPAPPSAAAAVEKETSAAAAAVLMNKRIKKLTTDMYYRQSKFNLLGEESQGYAKLITYLSSLLVLPKTTATASSSSSNATAGVIKAIYELIGIYELDPNRVLDVTMDILEWGLYETIMSLLQQQQQQQTTTANANNNNNTNKKKGNDDGCATPRAWRGDDDGHDNNNIQSVMKLLSSSRGNNNYVAMNNNMSHLLAIIRELDGTTTTTTTTGKKNTNELKDDDTATNDIDDVVGGGGGGTRRCAVVHLLGFKYRNYYTTAAAAAATTTTTATTMDVSNNGGDGHVIFSPPQSLHLLVAYLSINGVLDPHELIPHLTATTTVSVVPMTSTTKKTNTTATSLLQQYVTYRIAYIEHLKKLGVVSLNSSSKSKGMGDDNNNDKNSNSGNNNNSNTLTTTSTTAVGGVGGGGGMDNNYSSFSIEGSDPVIAIFRALLAVGGEWDTAVAFLAHAAYGSELVNTAKNNTVNGGGGGGGAEEENKMQSAIDLVVQAACTLSEGVAEDVVAWVDSAIDNIVLVKDDNENTKLLSELSSRLLGPLTALAKSGRMCSYQNLYIKLCRIYGIYAQRLFKSNDNQPMVFTIDEDTMSVLTNFLVPTLSVFSPNNTTLPDELWSVLSNLPYDVRYKLYSTWRRPGLEKVSLSVMSPKDIKTGNVLKPLANIESEIQTGIRFRKVFRRISKENIAIMGRQLAQTSHNNPLVVFTDILDKIESYDNMILMMVDTFQFITKLGLDVIGYCLLVSLGGGEDVGQKNRTKSK